jgi:hypothetical protein
MRVGLEDADELHLLPAGGVDVLDDVVRGIHDDRDSGVLFSDEVRSAPQIIVDELPEQHLGDRSNACGYIS